MGGQATAVADAYLLDPTIADKVIVAWQAGWLRPDGRVAADGSYNMSIDPWASYIVMDRLRTVLFVGKGAADGGIPQTPKSRLTELPNTELRTLMTEAGWPRVEGFWEPTMEIDGPPAIALTRSDYVMETRRISLVGWEPSPWDSNILLPIYGANPGGDVLAVVRASEPVGTEEWWKRVTAAEAWGSSVGQVAYRLVPTGNARTKTALTGPAWPVPGRIEAEDFDHGGTGRSYRDSTNNFEDGRFNPVRFLEHIDIEASDTASGGLFVDEAVADEWIEYSLDVASNATYTIEVRVASSRGGGTFRIEIDGVNQTGSITVPDTGANQWTTISIPNVALSAGPHVARLVMESNGAGGEVGAFDSLRFSR
jgi:hypothetical protein